MTQMPLELFVFAFLYVFLYGAQAVHASYFNGELTSMKAKLEVSCGLALIVGAALLIFLGVRTTWYQPIVLFTVSISIYAALRFITRHVCRRLYMMGGAAQSAVYFCFDYTFMKPASMRNLGEVGFGAVVASLFAFIGWPATAFVIWRIIDGLIP